MPAEVGGAGDFLGRPFRQAFTSLPGVGQRLQGGLCGANRSVCQHVHEDGRPIGAPGETGGRCPAHDDRAVIEQATYHRARAG